MDFWTVVFIGFLWSTCSLVCAIWEGASRMTTTGASYTSALEKITTCSLFTEDSVLEKAIGLFSPQLWSGMLDMATFNYPILYHEFGWLKFIVFGTITIGIVYILALQALKLFRGGG